MCICLFIYCVFIYCVSIDILCVYLLSVYWYIVCLFVVCLLIYCVFIYCLVIYILCIYFRGRSRARPFKYNSQLCFFTQRWMRLWDSTTRHHVTASCPYLDLALNETLRLYTNETDICDSTSRHHVTPTLSTADDYHTNKLLTQTQVYEPEGLEGPQPPSRATPSFFGHTLNFSGRSQQPEMKKNRIY